MSIRESQGKQKFDRFKRGAVFCGRWLRKSFASVLAGSTTPGVTAESAIEIAKLTAIGSGWTGVRVQIERMLGLNK